MEPSEYNNHPISISDSSNKHAIIDNRGKLYISDDDGQQLAQIFSSQRFTDVFQSENSIGMIAENGQVYLLGSNISGIIPNVDQILYPTKLDLGFSYSAKKIVLGEASLAILMNNQKIYFYGSLGGESYNEFLNLEVCDISGMVTEYGDTYAAVSEKGRAYFWNKSALPGQPRVVFLQEPARKVSLGNNHVLVLAKSGNVYSWGQNNFSQLGSIWGSKFKGSKSPINVQLNEPIKFISAGIFNSLALTKSGQLYVWGLVTFPIQGQTDQARLGWIDKPLKITIGSPIEYAVGNNDLLITVDQGTVNYSETVEGKQSPKQKKLYKLLREPIKQIEYYDGKGSSQSGINIITTQGNEKYVVKIDINPKGQIQANEIAKLLGINVPEMIVFPPEMISWKDELRTNLPSEGDRIPDNYIAMEFLENAKIVSDIKIPREYCSDAYEQAGKIIVFDLFIGNNDRFYFIEFDRCDNDVNNGNLLYVDHKLYSIDHTANPKIWKDLDLYQDLFSGKPYTDITKNVISCVLTSMNQGNNCPNKQRILDSAEQTVGLIRKYYTQIKQIFPDAKELPPIKG